ncbi:MAG: lasso peptide biosynthesis B2 protein [Bacteroidales bacterium]|nr:lasso peptide biosynthesis B2 protein [Bacteroidales bacterium]
MSRLKRFLEVSGPERRLFLEALILHMWIGLLLKAVPFRWIPRLFSSPQSAVHSRQSIVGSPQSAVIEMIRDAIKRASGVSPWKNKCLVSSLAGRCMLRRRSINSQISLGMARDTDGKMTAHAWLLAEGLEIVPSGERFHELYKF